MTAFERTSLKRFNELIFIQKTKEQIPYRVRKS